VCAKVRVPMARVTQNNRTVISERMSDPLCKPSVRHEGWSETGFYRSSQCSQCFCYVLTSAPIDAPWTSIGS
jgi:hypothetical protein